MPYTPFNTLCAALPATTHVIQWGGSHVWKVGAKVFAIGVWEAAPPAGPGPAFTFKVSYIGFEMLKHAPGCRTAAFFASAGRLARVQQCNPTPQALWFQMSGLAAT